MDGSAASSEMFYSAVKDDDSDSDSAYFSTIGLSGKGANLLFWCAGATRRDCRTTTLAALVGWA